MAAKCLYPGCKIEPERDGRFTLFFDTGACREHNRRLPDLVRQELASCKSGKNPHALHRAQMAAFKAWGVKW